jgi:phosphatidylglycerophosphate synthase
VLDRYALATLKPILARLASGLKRLGISANQLTFVALGLGLASAACISMQNYLLGLALLLFSRLCDGLDGALARMNAPTDLGAYLDITFDFVFYASIPLAFAWANPMANSLAAATLLAAFIATGSSFLAYAILAEKRGLKNSPNPNKGFFFLGGLTEGTETILVFAAMTIWPQWFAPMAYAFSALCVLTVVTRISAALKSLR